MTHDCSLAVFDFFDLLRIGHLVQTELLCHLWADLCRVTIDSLASAEDEVDMEHFLVDLLDCFGKEISRSEGISSRTLAVGKQPAFIGTAVETLTEDLASTGRTHRDNTDVYVLRIQILQAQSLLQRVEVFGVEDGRQRSTVHRALSCHGILTDITRVGYLLGKYYNVQFHVNIIYNYVLFQQLSRYDGAKLQYFYRPAKELV